MKAFFASFIGTLLALAAFCATAILLVLGGFAILMSSSGGNTIQVENGSYLVLNLDGTNITDAPPLMEEGGLGDLLRGDAPRPIALRQATAGLHHAAKDHRIRGVFLTGSFSPAGYGTGFAALSEFRSALAEVKASGKPVKAYFDVIGTAKMYVAAVGDEIVLNPFGLVAMPGLASEPMFYGDAFEKWGVGVQVTRSGKYKGAVEPFIRRDLSPENREQLTVLLEDLWTNLRKEIAASRGIKVEALQTLVDAEGLITPESAHEAGLVTAIGYRDEVLDALRKETGADKGDPFLQVAFADYLALLPKTGTGNGTVAVIYAEGEIVDGEGGENEVGGATYARELRSLREDDDVHAVVLRVNSPGGSASAAEEMLRELRLLSAKKPVVISMGSYAASGGYWISAFGDRIFTEPSTVTGSIGVFGVQFDVEKLAASIGLTWDRVQTGQKAGMMTNARPKSPGELAVFQRLVDHTYDQFLERVAEGRSMEKAKVHSLAQGRVWSGEQAVKLGLADEIGGLNEAIAHAAKLGKIEGAPDLYEFPGTLPLGEALAEAFRHGTNPETRLAAVRGPAGRMIRQVDEQVRMLDRFNDPRGVYCRLPLDLRIR